MLWSPDTGVWPRSAVHGVHRSGSLSDSGIQALTTANTPFLDGHKVCLLDTDYNRGVLSPFTTFSPCFETKV